MSAHVLLNLSNAFGETDKIHGLPNTLKLFRNTIVLSLSFQRKANAHDFSFPWFVIRGTILLL